MLAQPDRLTERLTREVVDGKLAVVKMPVGDVSKVLGDQRLDFVDPFANRDWAHLLIVTDDNDALAQVPGKQAHHIGLARLVYDHDVETSLRCIEALRNARQRHDPDG